MKQNSRSNHLLAALTASTDGDYFDGSIDARFATPVKEHAFPAFSTPLVFEQSESDPFASIFGVNRGNDEEAKLFADEPRLIRSSAIALKKLMKAYQQAEQDHINKGDYTPKCAHLQEEADRFLRMLRQRRLEDGNPLWVRQAFVPAGQQVKKGREDFRFIKSKHSSTPSFSIRLLGTDIAYLGLEQYQNKASLGTWRVSFPTYLMYENQTTAMRAAHFKTPFDKGMTDNEVIEFMSSDDVVEKAQATAYELCLARLNMRLNSTTRMPLKVRSKEA